MSAGERESPLRYEIRVQGHLHSRWAAWFDGLHLDQETGGVTVIHGPVVDQAALHGLLHKLRDVGLPLLSVSQVDAPAATTPVATTPVVATDDAPRTASRKERP
jgi:hypothetical protein